ncbi:MAG: hypothetical protein ABIQ16_09960 [Polyangiaceae bacterium]
MKTRELSLATFVLAAFGASIAACGAHGTSITPDSEDTAAGRAGAAGAQMTIPGAGSGGSVTSAAGASAAGAATIGAGAPGSAGAGVSFGGALAAGGAATGGAATGGAGAPATGCVLAAGTIADLLIDDLEDGDGAVKALGGRKGYWYTFNDGTAMQVPTSSATIPFKPAAMGSSMTPMYAAVTSGPAFTMWGAGIGFHFNEAGSNLCAYNATAYAGIKFWAKTTAPFKAMVQIPATTLKATASDDATCVAKCNDHFFVPVPIAAWTEYTIDFAAATFKQEGWGTPAVFDKTHLIGMQFQVAMGVAFDFAIDDVTFY